MLFSWRDKPQSHRQKMMEGKPEELPGVTVPLLSLMKHGLSLAMLSMVLPWRGNSSTFTSTGPEDDRQMSQCMHTEQIRQPRLINHLLTFPGRHHDRDDLLIKMSRLLCSFRSVLGPDSKLVLLLPIDAPLLRHILS